MSQPNPYTSPEQSSPSANVDAEPADATAGTRASGRILARSVEYAIAILLIGALMFVFIQSII